MPRLIGIAGPPEGREYPVGAEPVVIGRDPGVAVPIKDSSASRRHCRIERRGDTCVLTDLESLNGTLVNGVPVRERVLAHGDQIRVGQSLFLFATREEAPQLTSVVLRDGPAVQATLRLTDLTPGVPRAEGELEALLGLAVTLAELRELPALQQAVLETALRLSGARRGAVLIGDDPARSFAWDAELGSASVEVSRALADEVMSGRAAILAADAMAAPLPRPGACLGLLYAESPVAGGFSERDLRLFTALAGLAAPAVESLLTLERLRAENARLASALDAGELVGESAAMRDAVALLSRAAKTAATVLLLGESGTGKELAARALHRGSPRAAGPFVAVNCAALSESLLESELFGHEKGAFTGAAGTRQGRFEQADGGTLFLDEVGELPLALQAKLLRALQEREVDRVGGTRPIRVDIRLVAATNRDLAAAVKEGRFRSDLYFRLNVVAVTLPALRERKGDVPLLASYFLARSAEACKRRVHGFTPEARRLLERYDWPGNVRELQNAVERAVVLGAGDVVGPEDLPELAVASEPARDGGPAAAGSFHEAVNEAKRRIVLQAFERSGGVVTEAARILGLHPNYLHRLVASLDLRGQIRR